VPANRIADQRQSLTGPWPEPGAALSGRTRQRIVGRQVSHGQDDNFSHVRIAKSQGVKNNLFEFS